MVETRLVVLVLPDQPTRSVARGMFRAVSYWLRRMAFEGRPPTLRRDPMTATRTILSLGLLAGLLAGTASARAGEAVLFKNGAPQAADLARILWPAKKQAQGAMGATRSIRINPDLAPEAAAASPAAHVEYAEAGPPPPPTSARARSRSPTASAS